MKKKIRISLTLLALMVSNLVSSQNYYFENFETQPITAPTNNSNSCSNATWPLSGGLTNASNDDIEWIVLTGTNIIYGASFPLINFDHTLGTSAGRYICISETDDCFNNTAHLETDTIDLTNAVNPKLTFWYHMWDQFVSPPLIYGSLNVDVYSNGNWVNNITPTLSGDSGNQWHQVQVSLSAYLGQNIKLRFRGVTGDFSFVTFGIDDIVVEEPATAAPIANIGVNLPSCQNSTVFIDSSTNTPSSWNWNFGTNATPQTAIGPGPHTVIYSNTSPQTVTLVVSNSFGSSTITQNIQPAAASTSNFSWTSVGQTFSFTNLSSNANTFSWNFGDGTLPVNSQNPTHTYSNPGSYNVTLYATNNCGTDTFTKTITIGSTTGLDGLDVEKKIEISPNPSNEYFTISSSELRGFVKVQLVSIQGLTIFSSSYKINSNFWSQTIDVSKLAAGSYILKLTDNDQSITRKLFIE